MRLHLALLLCTSACAVWPPPQTFSADGEARPLAPDFSIVAPASNSARLDAAIARVTDRLAPARAAAAAAAENGHGTSAVTLRTLTVEIATGATEHLGMDTKYDYELELETHSSSARVNAASVYGAMYALETFSQLVDSAAGSLRHSAVSIRDGPDYAWRGLMIDSGRRFVPTDTLENLLDTMAAVKLNVLHLHASDMCRFGVESKLFPNLTASLTGIHAGFYSQSDVKALIAYAKDRGIRVVPEFDIPGHSRGFIPVESKGIKFCTDDASRNQLDGTNATYDVLHAVLGEMAALFEDEVFNIGSDETSAKGVCTVQTSLDIERRVLNAVETEFGKTAEGWEEVLFDAGAATNKTIVNAWARHSAAQITATGRRAVESKSSSFYFTAAAPGGPKGWSKCWYDIGTGVPADQKALLLGGEMSMWTDTYCYTTQCGAFGSGAPVGHALFAPAQDAAFAKSIGGMIWPRGYVGAAAFWNFNATADPAAADFVDSIWALNDQLVSRGALVCPTNCSCDQLSACGTPYIAAPVPAEGAGLALAPCGLNAGSMPPSQGFSLDADGTMRLSANRSLCVQFVAKETYPLRLAACPAPAALLTDAGEPYVFSHKASSEIVHTASGECLDAKSQAEVGTWSCASSQDQPNQHWSVDTATNTITSLSTYSSTGVGAPTTNVAGMCLTASAN